MLSALILLVCTLLRTQVQADADPQYKAHDAIRTIPENVAPDSIYKRYQPYLKVTWGCVPFPAVDAEGFLSGGLKTSGTSDGDCRHNLGQIYVRAGWQHGKHGIMYSWFFPKEQFLNSPRSHRFGWQSLTVWLDPNPYVVKYTGEYSGRWLADTHWAVQDGRPLFEKRFGQLWSDVNGTGGQQPLVLWDNLSDAAKAALNIWRDDVWVECPFNDDNFEINLTSSYLEPGY